MKILIYGAGVIGQIYAARLHEAGHDVTVLARHRTLETLARDGITLVNRALVDGTTSGPVRVNVTGHVGPDSSFELALVTVRRDQVGEILPAMAALQASHMVMMQNNSLELASVGDIVGRDRTLFGFPGVGGYRRDDGAIEYIEIPQQPTTLGRQQGREEIVGEVFKSAGFAVATTADMDGWLKTHAVFIAAICGSINSCGGDAVKLAADRERVATMIRSAGEGFRALTSKGVAVQPRPLRMIFTVVPQVFAVRYWQGQLRGTVGTVALAPHSKMTKDTELPVLYRDVQKLVGGTVPTPHLDKLLSLTPLLCLTRIASRQSNGPSPLSYRTLATSGCTARQSRTRTRPGAGHNRACSHRHRSRQRRQLPLQGSGSPENGCGGAPRWTSARGPGGPDKGHYRTLDLPARDVRLCRPIVTASIVDVISRQKRS
jgi:2-dehydropantoate 2-reductase